MQDSIIYKSVRRSNRNLLLTSLVCLIFTVGMAVFSSVPYFSAKFADPTPIGLDELTALEVSNAPLYFREVTGDFTLDTGYYEYTEENGIEISRDAYFGLTLVGDYAVLVRTETFVNENQTTFVGTFVKPDSIQREIFDDLLLEIPELGDFLIPLVLDTVDEEVNWYGGAIVLAVLGAISIIGLIVFVRRTVNPANHPNLKHLKRYGEVEQVVQSIESDRMLGETPVTQKVSLTHRWVLYHNGGAFEAAQLDSVVWVYKMVTQHRTNGIPTGKSYKAFICDVYGRMIEIPGKEDTINNILTSVATRAPWAILGYTDEIKAAWEQDRQQILSAVQQRKTQLRQAQ